MALGQARWLAQSYRVLAKEGFQENPIVYGCVTKIAKAAASVELQLYDYTRQGQLRKIDRHPILDLIQSPNLAWSGRQFLEKAATQYLIGGEAFLLGNNGERAPSELWLLPPDSVTVDAPRGGLLPGIVHLPPRHRTENLPRQPGHGPLAGAAPAHRQPAWTSGVDYPPWPLPRTAWTSSTPVKRGTSRCCRTSAAHPGHCRCGRGRTARHRY